MPLPPPASPPAERTAPLARRLPLPTHPPATHLLASRSRLLAATCHRHPLRLPLPATAFTARRRPPLPAPSIPFACRRAPPPAAARR
jgi:hypothetical protein